MGTIDLAASLAATKSSSSGTNYLPLLIIVVLFGLLYFVMIRPQRNRQRKVQQTQRQVVPGQRIRTTAGMYGTVVSGDDRDVVVEVAPGVRITMLRRAVMDVVSDDGVGPTGFAADQTVRDQASADPATADQSSADDRGDLTI